MRKEQVIDDRFRTRGWLIEEKKMVTVTQVDCDRKIAWVRDLYIGYNIPEEIILMQCAGLPDKEGTMIYDGDMVYSHSLGHAQIVFSNGVFWIHSPMHGIHTMGDEHEFCTIVGNIYEEKEPEYTCGECTFFPFAESDPMYSGCRRIGVVQDTLATAKDIACDLFEKREEYTCKDCIGYSTKMMGISVCYGKLRQTTPNTPACEEFVCSKQETKEQPFIERDFTEEDCRITTRQTCYCYNIPGKSCEYCSVCKANGMDK